MTEVMMGCGHAANAVQVIDGERYPVCAICVGLDPMAQVEIKPPDLTGRFAKCAYNNPNNPDAVKTHMNEPIPSSMNLAFFEFKGEGSLAAVRKCKNCWFMDVGHEITDWHKEHDSTCQHCDHFEPHGAYEFDEYYCGCRGWD